MDCKGSTHGSSEPMSSVQHDSNTQNNTPLKNKFKVPFKSPLVTSHSDTRDNFKSSPQSRIKTPSGTRKIKGPSKFKSPLVNRSQMKANTEESLEGEIVKAKEELRRLNLVEYHRKHNDLNVLKSLTDKWQEAGHKALHELHSLINCEPKPSYLELLKLLNIPTDHIDCKCDE